MSPLESDDPFYTAKVELLFARAHRQLVGDCRSESDPKYSKEDFATLDGVLKDQSHFISKAIDLTPTFMNGWNWMGHPSRQERLSIKGKYLFFSPSSRVLLRIALKEMQRHNILLAKISAVPVRGEHVLCLYYRDDSLKLDLAKSAYYEHGLESYGPLYCQKRDLGEFHGPFLGKYRWWKSNEATDAGIYSIGFLNKLAHAVGRFDGQSAPKESSPPVGFKPLLSRGTIYEVRGPDDLIFYIGWTSKSVTERRKAHLHHCTEQARTWDPHAPKPFPLLLSMLKRHGTAELLHFVPIMESGTRMDECRLVEAARDQGHPILNIGVPCLEFEANRPGQHSCQHGGSCIACGITPGGIALGQHPEQKFNGPMRGEDTGWALKACRRILTHFRWGLFSSQTKPHEHTNPDLNQFVFSSAPAKPGIIMPSLRCWNTKLEPTDINLSLHAGCPMDSARWWWKHGYVGSGSRESCYVAKMSEFNRGTLNVALWVWASPYSPIMSEVNYFQIVTDMSDGKAYLIHLDGRRETVGQFRDGWDRLSEHLDQTSFAIPSEDIHAFASGLHDDAQF